MNFEAEIYSQAQRRQEQLAGIENSWQFVEWEYSQRKEPFLNRAKNWFHRFAQNLPSGFNFPIESKGADGLL